MKQLLILSGKGGTGKTTLASAFIKLAQPKAYADCDVDAPNLHLVMNNKEEPREKAYYGLPKAEINDEFCNRCDICRANCRFDAIEIAGKESKEGEEGEYIVDVFACEGCGVCEFLCPTKAIIMKDVVDGKLELYSDKEFVFSTAQLKMGSGTSGLLVTEVKKQMKEEVDRRGLIGDFSIIDGSPGIGCPVIASLSGVDMVLIVAEPSVSGISDMERIISTADKFGVKTAVCVNKYDTNKDNTKRIEEFCKEKGIAFAGRIPYDLEAVRAVNEGKTVVEIDCPAGQGVKKVYEKTIKLLLS